MESVKGKKGLISYLKNSAWKRRFFSVCLAFAFVCALPAMLSVQQGTWYTNSAVAFLLWLLTAGLADRVLQHDFAKGKCKWLIPLLFGLLFSVCMVFGADLEGQGCVDYADGGMWISILVLTVCGALFVRYSWDKLIEWMTLQAQEEKAKQPQESAGFHMRSFWMRLLVIELCYLPVLLAVYPGFFVYDAQTEIVQIMTRNFTTQHPLAHVLFMGGIVQLFAKISGSYNIGIACYTFIQMTVLAGIFSFATGLLQKEGMKKMPRVLLTLYYGLFPVIVMFSLCSAKDGLFMGMVLILVMMLRELVADGGAFWEKKGHVLLLTLSALGMMLLRHNGYYAWVVFGVVLCVFLKKIGILKEWKKVLLLFVGTICVYLAVNHGLTRGFHAVNIGKQEMLTVPIQQLARVHQLWGDELDEEDKTVLYEILPKEALENYAPKLSDGVKFSFHNGNYNADSTRYQKLWWKLACEYPQEYLNAWFMTSYGFWYPDAVIDVYRGNSGFTFVYEDSSYFGYEVEQPGERESKLPLLDEFYRKLSLEITQQKIPVISMLFSPGFLFWIFVFVLCFMWYMGEVKRMFPYFLPGFIWLTFLLGPTYLVRYVVYLWCLWPMLLCDVRLINRNNCDILTKANCEEDSGK